jgi:MFS family permease
MSEGRELDIIQVSPSVRYYLKDIAKVPCVTVCLCWGATGPLYAGYMLAGGYSWRLYFYVIIAFAGALFIMAFIFVEETHYDRKPAPKARSPTTSTTNGDSELKEDKGDELRQHVEEANVIPPRKSFLATLKPWSKIDHEAEFFMTMVRSFTYIPVPAVFWVITSFGKHCKSPMWPRNRTDRFP